MKYSSAGTAIGKAFRGAFLSLTFVAAFTGTVMQTPRSAIAACCEATTCSCMTAVATGLINPHTTAQFRIHELWMVTVFFNQYILPAMMKMTIELETVGMQQMQILGTFLDAKHLLETQRLYQQLAAQAHKDYHPSEGLCTMGTTIRSLAASDRHADVVAHVLAQRSIGRQLLNANTNAARGPADDRSGRLRQFRTRYCDQNDNNGALTDVCEGSPQQERKNKDIDYTRTVAHPLTITVNFDGNGPTEDEQDLLALSANLYAHDIFRQIPPTLLKNNEANQQLYMDLRSIVAKRSVAEHSFQAIAAMKASGASTESETGQYLAAALQELGMTQQQALAIVGSNPSYYAQMEILTKSIYQRPEFFIDLYDKPANVARKGVALQAISLMQDRDLFKSNLRSEAMLSILLELEVMKAQTAVQNELNRITKQ